jgi:serine/threonine protein kinase
MSYKCWSNNEIVIISSQPFGSGGEATVHELIAPSHLQGLIAKIYIPSADQKSNKERRIKKLLHYYNNKTRHQRCYDIAFFPIDILYQGKKESQNIVGFLMRKAENSMIIANTWDKERRKELVDHNSPKTSYRIAANLAHCIATLHRLHIVPVDLNESNFMVHKSSHKVMAIDTDSFQLLDSGSKEVLLCGVGKDEYKAPEVLKSSTQRVEIYSNNFSLAIIIFQILTGNHPFRVANKSAYQSSNANYTVENIKQGIFAYGKNFYGYDPNPQNRNKYNKIPSSIQTLFYQCFIDGHSDPNKRPSAQEWANTLASLVSTTNPSPVFHPKPTSQQSSRATTNSSPVLLPHPTKQDRQKHWVLLRLIVLFFLILVGKVMMSGSPILMKWFSDVWSSLNGARSQPSQATNYCGDPWVSGSNTWYRVSAQFSPNNFNEIKESICCNASIDSREVPGIWVASYRSQEKARKLVERLSQKGIQATVLDPIRRETEKPSDASQCGTPE